MTDSKDAEIDELRARLARLEQSPGPPSPPPTPPAKKGIGCGPIAAVLLLVLGIGYCSLQGGGTDTSSFASPEPAWTPPEGFVSYPTGRGGSIGVQWETPERGECRGSGTTCFAINVVAAQPCSSLYVSISLLNAAGDNIGWTNDTAQGVLPGERSRLVFTTYTNNVESARIADVSCH